MPQRSAKGSRSCILGFIQFLISVSIMLATQSPRESDYTSIDVSIDQVLAAEVIVLEKHPA